MPIIFGNHVWTIFTLFDYYKINRSNRHKISCDNFLTLNSTLKDMLLIFTMGISFYVAKKTVYSNASVSAHLFLTIPSIL